MLGRLLTIVRKEFIHIFRDIRTLSLIGFINLWATIGLGSIWFNVPLASSMPLLAALSLMFIMGSLGLGILISVVARSQIQVMHIAMFINLPSLLLSGFIFPRNNMPLPVYIAGIFLPLTYVIEINRGIAIKGVGKVTFGYQYGH